MASRRQTYFNPSFFLAVAIKYPTFEKQFVRRSHDFQVFIVSFRKQQLKPLFNQLLDSYLQPFRQSCLQYFLNIHQLFYYKLQSLLPFWLYIRFHRCNDDLWSRSYLLYISYRRSIRSVLLCF